MRERTQCATVTAGDLGRGVCSFGNQARDLHNSDPVLPKTPTQLACDAAKSNRDLLAKGKPGHMYADKDGDGKPDLLSEDDVKKAKDQVESQIKANCKAE